MLSETRHLGCVAAVDIFGLASRCCHFKLRFHPHKSAGASPMAFSLPSPGFRAGTFSGACFVTHSAQAGHQEPGVSLAMATQDSKSSLGGPPLQYWYLGFAGGLTTPAMCPEPAIT